MNDKERIAQLEHALKFYADPVRYRGPNQRLNGEDQYGHDNCPYVWDVNRDGGSIARSAIGIPDETCPHCDNLIEDGEEHCSLCRRKL